ncbi:MAG: nucleotide exchange factor GrpE [Methylobacteriaceae bacterium]|nr:nucleotide exchange factor GrpE [Methylobacteriaceae bacterium]
MTDTTAPAAAPDEAAAPPAEAGAAEPDPFKVVEALNAENAGLKDRLLRTMAEMENLRRRTEKEVADARLYAVTNFAREMTGVADNLRRALDSLTPEARAAHGALVEGVELTERDLLARLGRFQVKKLEPQGQKFDPNFHEALFEIPDETQPAGTVLQVVEQGYAIGERVLRPAKVGVARGGPKA